TSPAGLRNQIRRVGLALPKDRRRGRASPTRRENASTKGEFRIQVVRKDVFDMSQPIPMVKVSIDGQDVEVPSGTTIFDAAQKVGIKIPILCHREYMTPVAVCRVC